MSRRGACEWAIRGVAQGSRLSQGRGTSDDGEGAGEVRSARASGCGRRQQGRARRAGSEALLSCRRRRRRRAWRERSREAQGTDGREAEEGGGRARAGAKSAFCPRLPRSALPRTLSFCPNPDRSRRCLLPRQAARCWLQVETCCPRELQQTLSCSSCAFHRALGLVSCLAGAPARSCLAVLVHALASSDRTGRGHPSLLRRMLLFDVALNEVGEADNGWSNCATLACSVSTVRWPFMLCGTQLEKAPCLPPCTCAWPCPSQ